MSALLKLLTPLIHPAGLAWLLLLVTAGLCARRGRRRGASVAAVAAVLFWCLGQPRLVLPLYARLETPWLGSTLDQAPSADAVVVLGGGWRTSIPELGHLDLNDAIDRLATGAELCRRGLSATLVLGGDAARPHPRLPPESARIQGLLRTWGLVSQEILTLGPVHSTAEEAERTLILVRERGWKKVLLVTSAFHMRRAVASFRKAGIPVHPVACDFRFAASADATPAWQVAPGDDTLSQLGLWWHEELGWWVYRILGRI